MGPPSSRSAPAGLPTPCYLVGLGGNRRHGRHGAPAKVLAAATVALAAAGLRVRATAPVIATLPVGPGTRRFANSAVLIETPLAPPALLALLKQVERAFGRRRNRRWGDRVLDLDILLWSEGEWRSPGLAVPHRLLARRAFVLAPVRRIASGWRVPGGVRIRHLHHRLTAPRPLHRWGRTVGL